MTTTVNPAQRRSTIPGPTGGRLLGMAGALRADVLGTLLDGFRRYGDVVAYRFGPPRGPRWLRGTAVAAYHPDDVHRVFTNGREFSRHTVTFATLREMMGDGLLTSDGDVWLRQRRTLQPLFTPRRVTGYADLMAAEAERIVAEPVEGTVDLHELMQRYTLRVVGRALFGDEIEDAVGELRRLVPLTGDLVLARTMQFGKLPLTVPTPRNRRFRRVQAAQYRHVDPIIARHRDTGADDLLARLRAARDPDTGAPLSAAEIRDQVLIFLLAGHETTAGALTFTLHQLGRHPEIQDRVAAGDDALVRAALMEGMRLYPPVYSTERLAAADTSIGGYAVPAGYGVVVSQYVTHRHPAFWPDPERFDPWRFVGTHDRPRYAYFPFGGGARSCIGEHFALLEATILLKALLARYRVTAFDAGVPLRALITLRPAGPVRATLTRR